MSRAPRTLSSLLTVDKTGTHNSPTASTTIVWGARGNPRQSEERRFQRTSWHRGCKLKSLWSRVPVIGLARKRSAPKSIAQREGSYADIEYTTLKATPGASIARETDGYAWMGKSEEGLGADLPIWEGNGTFVVHSKASPVRSRTIHFLQVCVKWERNQATAKSKSKTQNPFSSTASDGCPTLHSKSINSEADLT